MRTKFIIVGRSGSGKDYLTNYICSEFGFKQLLSYSTRPKRFDNENTHIFITGHEADEIVNSQTVIAYTEIGQYVYFGTYEQFIESDVYIVDKNGIDYLKNNFTEQLIKENIQIVVIYVYAPETLRLERALKRNADISTIKARFYAENNQFDLLEKCIEYDWFVNNQNGEHAKKIIKEIINE